MYLRYAITGAILVILLFGLFFRSEVYAQSSSDAPTEAPLAMLSKELKTRFGPVRYHREEEFEDRFIVHGLSQSDFGLLPRFFQIQSPRFSPSGNNFLENVTSRIPTMYIASSPDESHIYKLYGFTNSEEDFNRLVGDGPTQHILDAQEAESRGLLCGEVVYGLSPQWWIVDASNAKLQSAKHFFDMNHSDAVEVLKMTPQSFSPKDGFVPNSVAQRLPN